MLGLSSRGAARSVLDGEVAGGREALGELRRRVQMIFQDPYQTLNPRQRVGAIVAEPLVVQGVAARRARRAGRARARRRRPGPRALPRPLPAPALGRAAPAGGDRRGAGARARGPDLRRAGLDARRLRARADPRRAARAAERRGLALLFITHDLSLAWSLCDRIAVMYLGRMVEQGAAADVIERPQHPYTQALVDRHPGARRRAAAGGASCSGASCPTRPTCRPAAASTRAARGASSPATGWTRPLLAAGAPRQLAACLLHDPEQRQRRRGGRGRPPSAWLSAGATSRARSGGSSPGRATRSPTCPGCASATRRPGAASAPA